MGRDSETAPWRPEFQSGWAAVFWRERRRKTAAPVRPAAKSDKVSGSGTSVGASVKTVFGGLPLWVSQVSVKGKQLGSTGGRSSSPGGSSLFRRVLVVLPDVSLEESSFESPSEGFLSLSE